MQSNSFVDCWLEVSCKLLNVNTRLFHNSNRVFVAPNKTDSSIARLTVLSCFAPLARNTTRCPSCLEPLANPAECVRIPPSDELDIVARRYSKLVDCPSARMFRLLLLEARRIILNGSAKARAAVSSHEIGTSSV